MKSKRKSLRQMHLPIILFLLFQKNSTPKEIFVGVEKSEGEAVDFSRIRCPLCKWQPKASSRWFCADAGFPEYYFNGCGAMWNTFATGGICGGCGHRWQWTTCLSCGQWSPHKYWYVGKSD
ncbi:MAG TPA: hypothetical protein VNI84_09860 [Pyrinomonadaceae bacterium]|nr:hypothetical protein [Pyrinomonadaceae bacterium]